eukprot:m.193381 g.193381  ORF g.193381 m.193381 type:complete len:1580 (-) comp16780_c0_seq1:3109-7848(-)
MAYATAVFLISILVLLPCCSEGVGNQLEHCFASEFVDVQIEITTQAVLMFPRDSTLTYPRGPLQFLRVVGFHFNHQQVYSTIVGNISYVLFYQPLPKSGSTNSSYFDKDVVSTALPVSTADDSLTVSPAPNAALIHWWRLAILELEELRENPEPPRGFLWFSPNETRYFGMVNASLPFEQERQSTHQGDPYQSTCVCTLPVNPRWSLGSMLAPPMDGSVPTELAVMSLYTSQAGAQAYCEKQDATLVEWTRSFGRLQVHLSAITAPLDSEAYWIGIEYDWKTLKWRYLSGQPTHASGMAWAAHQPKLDDLNQTRTCVAMTSAMPFTLSVRPCDLQLPFICQRKPDWRLVTQELLMFRSTLPNNEARHLCEMQDATLLVPSEIDVDATFYINYLLQDAVTASVWTAASAPGCFAKLGSKTFVSHCEVERAVVCQRPPAKLTRDITKTMAIMDSQDSSYALHIAAVASTLLAGHVDEAVLGLLKVVLLPVFSQGVLAQHGIGIHHIDYSPELGMPVCASSGPSGNQSFANTICRIFGRTGAKTSYRVPVDPTAYALQVECQGHELDIAQCTLHLQHCSSQLAVVCYDPLLEETLVTQTLVTYPAAGEVIWAHVFDEEDSDEFLYAVRLSDSRELSLWALQNNATAANKLEHLLFKLSEGVSTVPQLLKASQAWLTPRAVVFAQNAFCLVELGIQAGRNHCQALPATVIQAGIGDLTGDGLNDILLLLETQDMLCCSEQSAAYECTAWNRRFIRDSMSLGLIGFALGHFDNDNRADVILYGEITLACLSDRSLQLQQTLDDHPAAGLLVGDFDGDGDDDLLIFRSDAIVPIINMDHQLQQLPARPLSYQLQSAQQMQTSISVDARDLDQDGRLDITIQASSGLTVLYNLGQWVFTELTPVSLPEQSVHIWTDWDRDGDDDFVALTQRATAVLANTQFQVCGAAGSYVSERNICISPTPSPDQPPSDMLLPLEDPITACQGMNESRFCADFECSLLYRGCLVCQSGLYRNEQTQACEPLLFASLRAEPSTGLVLYTSILTIGPLHSPPRWLLLCPAATDDVVLLAKPFESLSHPHNVSVEVVFNLTDALGNGMPTPSKVSCRSLALVSGPSDQALLVFVQSDERILHLELSLLPAPQFSMIAVTSISAMSKMLPLFGPEPQQQPRPTLPPAVILLDRETSSLFQIVHGNGPKQLLVSRLPVDTKDVIAILTPPTFWQPRHFIFHALASANEMYIGDTDPTNRYRPLALLKGTAFMYFSRELNAVLYHSVEKHALLIADSGMPARGGKILLSAIIPLAVATLPWKSSVVAIAVVQPAPPSKFTPYPTSSIAATAVTASARLTSPMVLEIYALQTSDRDPPALHETFDIDVEYHAEMVVTLQPMDLDGDGDLDLVVSFGSSQVFVAENTLIDLEKPQLKCVAGLDVPVADDAAHAIVRAAPELVSDNVVASTWVEVLDTNQAVSFASRQPPFVAKWGSSALRVTATDFAGNAAVCEVPIQVYDTTPPIIQHCPNPQLVINSWRRGTVGNIETVLSRARATAHTHDNVALGESFIPNLDHLFLSKEEEQFSMEKISTKCSTCLTTL